MDEPISIAIETSSGQGSAALGAGERILAELDFDAASRHAAQLVGRLDELLTGQGLKASQIGEVYVSVGPGSFTGTRIAVTVARMLAQTVEALRVVAVPTTAALAEGAGEMAWEHLGVILDAREGLCYAATFARDDGRIIPAGPEGVMTPAEYLAAAPRPLRLMGEGLGYHSMAGSGVEVLSPDALGGRPHLPSAGNVWRVGRRLSRAGTFTEYHRLEPLYCRKPEAERAWERKHGIDPASGPAENAGKESGR